MTQPILRIVPQRHAADCTVSVLATYAVVSYEEALVALSGEDPGVLYGTYTPQLEKAAAQLGITFKRLKKTQYRLDDEIVGILSVSAKAWDTDHWVILMDGKVLDTDGSVWEAEDYFAAKKAKPGLLLVEA